MRIPIHRRRRPGRLPVLLPTYLVCSIFRLRWRRRRAGKIVAAPIGEKMTFDPYVLGLFVSGTHSFSKHRYDSIIALKGLGIEGDAHCGVYVKHRYHAAKDPTRPNRRQVHLLQSEVLDEMNGRGFNVHPGDLGENICTRGIDLLTLPKGTLLRVGPEVIVEVTGLRNPCIHIEKFQKDLMAAFIDRTNGGVTYRAGIMGVISEGGRIQTSETIEVQLPEGSYEPLKVV